MQTSCFIQWVYLAHQCPSRPFMLTSFTLQATKAYFTVYHNEKGYCLYKLWFSYTMVYRGEGKIQSSFDMTEIFPGSLSYASIMYSCAVLFVSYVHSWGKLKNHTVIMWEISKAVWPPGLKWRAWEVCDKPPISLHLPTENTHVCVEERAAMLHLMRLFGSGLPNYNKASSQPPLNTSQVKSSRISVLFYML